MHGPGLAVILALLTAGHPSKPQEPASGSSSTSSTAPFEETRLHADEARNAGRLDEAAALYREALTLRPDWAEGWWYLGTISYDRDDFPQCRDAFRELVRLQPDMAPGWALRGLCTFELRDYTSARRDLDRALSAGPLGDASLGRVVAYHHALLRIRDSQFDLAIAPLAEILESQTETRELVLACGLLLLRRAQLPSEIPLSDLDLVEGAGRAYCAHLARKATLARKRFEDLLERYPRTRNLHYGFGLSLAQQGSAEAIEQFRREIALYPDHVLAHVELAFNLLNRGRPDEAVDAAQDAVRLDPGLFVTHLVLGRALVAAGDVAPGVSELESAARLAPKSADVFFALGRAYARAGRKDDAANANARFHELERIRGAGASP